MIEMHEPDCACHDTPGGWQPGDQHEWALGKVRRSVNKWGAKLPLLAGWTIRVSTLPGRCGEWSMRMDPAASVKIATFKVRGSALDGDDILRDECSVELPALHELAQLVFESIRYVNVNRLSSDEGLPQPALPAIRDAEETAVRAIRRGLAGPGRELQAAPEDAASLAQGPSNLAGTVVPGAARKKGAA